MSASTPTATTATATARARGNRGGGGEGVEKVILKLKKSGEQSRERTARADLFEEGNFYEAHQMYHSVCQRLVTQHKPADAIALLFSGAVELLTAKQIGSGSDLGLRMLDLFDAEKIALDTDSRNKVLEIFQAFDERQNTYCEDFVRRAVRWSATETSPAGDQSMHHTLGLRYFKEKEYYNAEHHFIYGTVDSAKALGRMAFQWSQEGYYEDAGYFIARGGLALLAQKKLAKAHIAYTTFLSELTAAKPDDVDSVLPFKPTTGAADTLTVTKHSLSNFFGLLLFIIQRDSKEEFSRLIQEYKAEVYGFDPYLAQLFERIAAVWFGLGPKKQANPMEELMKMFAGPKRRTILTITSCGDGNDTVLVGGSCSGAAGCAPAGHAQDADTEPEPEPHADADADADADDRGAQRRRERGVAVQRPHVDAGDERAGPRRVPVDLRGREHRPPEPEPRRRAPAAGPRPRWNRRRVRERSDLDSHGGHEEQVAGPDDRPIRRQANHHTSSKNIPKRRSAWLLQGYFVTYEQFKAYALSRKDIVPPFFGYLVSAGAASTISSSISNVFDVVKTRIQVSNSIDPAHTRLIAVAASMYKNEGGLVAFTHGMGARVLSIVPNAMISFTVFEMLKDLNKQ
ncbi:hypothetical protein HK100_003613 [Physocladia obscura]|uniref:Uncharacterized protein n=1 Tax=Physocladia obscura TaxID=109957 RepID=A0AAD5STY2_9FUNG|nr:hypothetical protein HK100_003613 [Physocladia obscura]